MGGTVGSMCKCEKESLCMMKKSEIIKQYPEEISQAYRPKSQNKTKQLKNSFQISGKITEFISPNKIEEIEDENNLLNTAKNSFPSNNAMTTRTNAPNISIFSDIPFNTIEIQNNNDNNNSNIMMNKNKIDIIFEQISKIEDNDIDKKFLFNRGSKYSIEELLNLFNKDSKNKNKNSKDNNNYSKYKPIIIDYEGEKCLFNGELEESKKLKGHGLLYFVSGKKLEGNFIDGKLNGHGKYTDENGTFFEGYFDHGELNGEGKIIKINDNNDSINSTKKNILNKVTYNGQIKNFLKEGFGKEVSIEYIYEGNFHNDMKNGKGKIKFINTGDSYEGEFTNDKITGYGNYKWSNKHQYIGDFIEGEMNGKGYYKWPDGTEYNGEYVNNIKEGYGEFKWSNGAIFKGKFHNGKPNGKGIMIYKGHSFNAEFKNGHFVGDLKSILKSINFFDNVQ